MKLSIHLTQVLRASSLGGHHLLGRELQHHLAAPQDEASSALAPVAGGFRNYLYAISISLGTPPQIFRAALDFSSSDLILPSALRDSQNRGPYRYNPSFSTTYRCNGTEIQSSQGGQVYEGWLSQDTFRIGTGIVPGPEITIPNMLFEEAPYMFHRKNPAPGVDLPIDTAFPLAPYNASYSHNFMSPLARLIESGSLDYNTFSLHLPTGPKDPNGWLTIGDSPPSDIEKYKTIPVTNLPINVNNIDTYPIPSEYFPGDKWKFKIDSFSIGNIYETYSNSSVAITDLATPIIGISKSLGEKVKELVGGANDWLVKYIDCETRYLLPNLRIVLAGVEFELTPFEYTVEEWVDENLESEMLCQMAFVPLPDEMDVVILGSSFLRGADTVWDLEKRMMSYSKATEA